MIKEDFKDASKGGVVLKPDNTDVPNTNTSSNDELNTHKIDKDTEAANDNPTESVLIDLLEYIARKFTLKEMHKLGFKHCSLLSGLRLTFFTML